MALVGAFNLPPGEAHVWHASLDGALARLETLCAALSSDERARAARYHFERDRLRYVAARGTLRAILARYLDIAPADVRFVYGSHGKPALAPEHGAALSFNVSHAGDVALYAVIADRRVGVDVERVDPQVSTTAVAEHIFSPREVAALRALPSRLQRDAFFRCWTRKEAYIKAVGVGLSLALDSFDVSLMPGQPPALLATRPDRGEAARWLLRDVDIMPDHVATLCVEGRDVRVLRRDWMAS